MKAFLFLLVLFCFNAFAGNETSIKDLIISKDMIIAPQAIFPGDATDLFDDKLEYYLSISIGPYNDKKEVKSFELGSHEEYVNDSTYSRQIATKVCYNKVLIVYSSDFKKIIQKNKYLFQNNKDINLWVEIKEKDEFLNKSRFQTLSSTHIETIDYLERTVPVFPEFRDVYVSGRSTSDYNATFEFEYSFSKEADKFIDNIFSDSKYSDRSGLIEYNVTYNPSRKKLSHIQELIKSIKKLDNMWKLTPP